MLYVWAYEQGSNSRRKMGTTAVGIDTSVTEEETLRKSTSSLSINGKKPETGEKATRIQDVLVPWVLPVKRGLSKSTTKTTATTTTRTTVVSKEDSHSPNHPASIKEDAAKGREAKLEPEPEPEILHRYYHLFVEGELRALVEEAGQAEGYRLVNNDVGDVSGLGNGSSKHEEEAGKWLYIKAVGWEADNWWLEGDVGLGRRS